MTGAAPEDWPAHRASVTFEPRVALVGAFVLSLVFACLTTISASLAACAAGLALLLIRQRPLFATVSHIARVNAFILLIWLTTPWTTPGQIIFRLAGIPITRAGVDLSILVSLKANAIVGVFLALVAPMGMMELGATLGRLKFPDKLVWLFMLMAANVSILGKTRRELAEAAKLRGFRPGNNALTYKTLASMVAILLIRATDRGKKIREAMLLRGFSGKLPSPSAARVTWADALLCAYIMMTILVIFVLEAVPVNV